MKLILVTLVGINILVAIWGIFLREEIVVDSKGSAAPAMEDRVKTITPAKPSVSSGANRSGDPRLCELVGPFSDNDDAAVFAERLRAIDIVSSVEPIELNAGSSYWVHLQPEESAAAAYRRLAELQSLKVESYVIGSGDLKNAVALGVFTQQKHAEETQSDLSKQGVDAVITTKPRTEVEIWVSIQPEYAEKISEITWQNLLDGMTSQERRQNFCLPVAS